MKICAFIHLFLYFRRPMTKGISPTEVQGLGAVLKLITSVTKNSDAARIAIGKIWLFIRAWTSL